MNDADLLALASTKALSEQTLIERLRIRAAIRRKAGRRTDGKPDRIAQDCDDAAKALEEMEKKLADATRRIAALESLGDTK